MNFDRNGINDHDEIVSIFVNRHSYTYALNNLDLDLMNRVTPPTNPCIKEPHNLDLKVLLISIMYF